jgi:hypothetical protein
VIVPSPTRLKFEAATPTTGSLKVTFHETVAAFEGFLPARVIDDTAAEEAALGV